MPSEPMTDFGASEVFDAYALDYQIGEPPWWSDLAEAIVPAIIKAAGFALLVWSVARLFR